MALRFELQVPAELSFAWVIPGCTFAFAYVAVGIATHLYRGRYLRGTFDEILAVAVTAMVLAAAVGVPFHLIAPSLELPRSLFLIALLIFVVASLAGRMLLRSRDRWKRREPPFGSGEKKAVLFGADLSAYSLMALTRDGFAGSLQIVGIIDNDSRNANLSIGGVRVLGHWKDLPSIISRESISAVVCTDPGIGAQELAKMHSDCKEFGLEMFILRTVSAGQDSQEIPQKMVPVGIEDLMGHRPPVLDTNELQQLISGSRIMVTGAGGSIGSELAKQIAALNPAQLFLLDRDETFLSDLLGQLEDVVPREKINLLLADIRDEETIAKLFANAKPQIVFHAAALKHVPFLEEFPEEGWKTNVLGTLNVLRSAADCGVLRFVNISTDKAANPQNVLGKTKQTAERLTAWFASETRQKFVSVRFGNVFGSRGSLVPLFSSLLAANKPLPVTHQDATRYFMRTSDACLLVLHAAWAGAPGEVLILDMGEPVKILDIAKKMAELAGRPENIVISGLRPGEKVHEELVGNDEKLAVRVNPLIQKITASRLSPADLSFDDCLSID